MLKNVMQPQEIEVFYIIPAIRACLAKALKDSGKSQKEIARLFSLRESTVSQYINNRRATLKMSKKTQEKIRKMAASIKLQVDVITAVQTALKEIKKSQNICEIHKKFAASIPHTCKICFRRIS